MNWIKEINNDKIFKADLQTFLNTYGMTGLKEAITLYTDMQQKYICKSKNHITKINILDIYYLRIHEHDISVYTTHGTYHKYGTLSKELEILSSYGFLKCNQSILVSLNKIRTISHDNIILVNGAKIHISRNYVPKVISEFSRIKT